MDPNQLDQHCMICAVTIKGAHKHCSEVRDTVTGKEVKFPEVFRMTEGKDENGKAHQCSTACEQVSNSTMLLTCFAEYLCN